MLSFVELYKFCIIYLVNLTITKCIGKGFLLQIYIERG